MKRKIAYIFCWGLTVLFTLLAILTVWPMHASKPNILGYYSHCSWVPWSTLILLALAGICCVLRNRIIKYTTL
jgi:hypothetical protein